MERPRFFERRYRLVLCALIAAACLTRLVLIVRSPRPFGYVWDLYHEGVVWTYEHGRLPEPSDCGECYHPPLYFICGAPLYALGLSLSHGSAADGLRALTLLSLLCAGVVIYYCHRSLSLLRPTRANLLLGTALALVFPCLFISSYAAENDALLAALMAAFFYRLCRYDLHPGRAKAGRAFVIGALAGLSALTKYSGLLALPAAAGVMAPRALFGRAKARAARDLLIVLLTATAVCGWHYARNWREHGTLFLEPTWAPGLFSGGQPRPAGYYFDSFRIEAVEPLFLPQPAMHLKAFPVYHDVFSSLHAQAWTDMSFFSVPGRHAWVVPADYGQGGRLPLMSEIPPPTRRVDLYPLKRVAMPLVDLTLRLGVLPTLLALAGALVTLRRRALRGFLVFAVLSLGVYFRWVRMGATWALKTKYLLFLLPVYVVYVALGLRAAFRADRRLGLAAAAGLIAALVVSEAYLLMFALG